MIWYQVALTWSALSAIVAVALLALFLVGMGLLVSALQVRYRDVGLAMPVLLRNLDIRNAGALSTRRRAPRSVATALFSLPVESDGWDCRHISPGCHSASKPGCGGASRQRGPPSSLVVPAAYIYFKFTDLTMADVV